MAQVNDIHKRNIKRHKRVLFLFNDVLLVSYGYRWACSFAILSLHFVNEDPLLHIKIYFSIIIIFAYEWKNNYYSHFNVNGRLSVVIRLSASYNNSCHYIMISSPCHVLQVTKTVGGGKFEHRKTISLLNTHAVQFKTSSKCSQVLFPLQPMYVPQASSTEYSYATN